MSSITGNIIAQMADQDARTAAQADSSTTATPKNPYLSRPVKPVSALSIFLLQARNSARKFLPRDTTFPVTKPFMEIEARIGILKVPYGLHDRRVASSGAKHAPAFECSSQQPRCLFESGVTRSHHVHWTQAGLSEASPISQALGVAGLESKQIKSQLKELEPIETVYGGYPQEDRRVCFAGIHPPTTSSNNTNPIMGKMEHKEKLSVMDLALPAAPYDLRMTLSAEKSLDNQVRDAPPPNWTTKRIKRRRSYTRADRSIAWQLDVTEVTTSYADVLRPVHVTYEIEMELNATTALQLVNESDDTKLRSMIEKIASQLWWMLEQINPLSHVMDVEEFLQEHPDKAAVRLALAQCGALKKFMDSKNRNPSEYKSPIGAAAAVENGAPSDKLANVKFVGCMPVNFSRCNLEEIQRSPENGYFLSEKTDGVRHFLIFTGTTAVLVDRAMKGKQPVPSRYANDDSGVDPLQPILSLIKPGTVLDGEVVMHRKLHRPIFIVFDVLALSTTEPILHLPFEQRLHHLRRASFRTPTANRDMFAKEAVMDKKVALPLVRKNFVKRTDLDNLLSHVVEEKGTRSYRNGDLHNHLTDGIIFQPNLPYYCGTDHNLLKWKYLDTVTIDVEILPPKPDKYKNDDDEDILRVGVLGEEGTIVDMTRYVHLPKSERHRLEADRQETKSKIAEVGFDPTTGEWYYLTMRPDKIAPNHISTVLGTLLELAESLTTEELRYRMSVPAGARDTYRKDVRGMQKQLLEHQRRGLQEHQRKRKAAALSSSASKR